MGIKIDTHEKYSVVHIEEEKLDSRNAPELKSEIVYLNKSGVKNIVVNMEKTRYCDSSGLSALLVGKRLCKEAEGSFVVCAVQEPVEKLVKISKLDMVLQMTPTLDEATDLVMMEEIERELGDSQ